MFSNFFVDRPIFACVISILLIFGGLVSLNFLPLEEFPSIDPPLIMVTASYPGANAKTIASNVAALLERQINGAEKMIYMSSQSSSSGEMSLKVFFEIGTNVDMAQVNVQNRVNTALALLPPEVQRNGITVKKQATGFLAIIAIDSTDGRYNDIFTSNYANLNIVDELLRTDGVSEARIIGAREYSMRIWLKPDLMAQLNITTQDVISAVRAQNADYALGQIGHAPTPYALELSVPVVTGGRLSQPEEFEAIVLRATLDGAKILLKDVARVELGAQSYDIIGELDGNPTTLIAVHQQFGSNALQVADNVKATMERVAKDFPAGLKYSIPYDTTQYIKTSIGAVVKTIFEAALLVTVIVWLFLQNVRATLIPLLAMLVSIVGTFSGMYLLGFSLNTLTLFGLILAVGIVVDDAIVVVENVERIIKEQGLSAKEATKIAMGEVSGPVIAIVFVLCAVFIPTAFLGGTVGQLYKQFAITISLSVIISGIVALTLSPALTALLLKPHQKESRFASAFNRGFEKLANFYLVIASWLAKHLLVSGALLLLICGLIALLFNRVPVGFLPQEDQGYFIVSEKLPSGSSLERTAKVADRIFEITHADPDVQNVISFTGYNVFGGISSNTGANFINLKKWDQRPAKDQHINAILQRLQAQYHTIRDSIVLAFNPSGGSISGLELWIQNRSNTGIEGLDDVLKNFINAAKQRPELSYLFSSFESNYLQLDVHLDTAKAQSLGIDIADAYQTLNALFGSVYINDFNMYGRVFKVIAQAEPDYRARLSDINEVYVRSSKGIMVPLKSILSMNFIKGPDTISRFNGFPAVPLNGNIAPGYSSGEAISAIEAVAKEVLPEGYTLAWSGRSYQEKISSGASKQILAAGLIMVFLILAALYEKWTLPLAVISTVPFGIFGAIVAIWLTGIDNDVYFQIGLITLIALSAKNAILIVEFASQKFTEGKSAIDAALEAARLRFRAILMTSLTFIFGVMPLVASSGAGAASRQSVGTGVLGGMIAATVLALLFVPLFFTIIMRASKQNGKGNVK